ncbi:MAG: hypothetical protein EP332_05770 [Bacteroidetes bacterium]|nr:MAG: hypothetical protein EP332_05770 [Bacteroidota bacterium]
MKIRLLFATLVWSSALYAQDMDRQRVLEFGGGYAGALGNIASANASKLTHVGNFDWGFGFGFYGKEGVMGKKDLFGMKLGWDFHYNSLQESSVEAFEPKPQSFELVRQNMMVHGPYVKVEYTLNYRVQPFIGLGAHLSAVRGSEIKLTYDPADNFYKSVHYQPKGWGRINPALSANAGFRILVSDKFAIAGTYEFMLRNSWATRYDILAESASSDYADLEQEWTIRQIGWFHHATVSLQFLLR